MGNGGTGGMGYGPNGQWAQGAMSTGGIIFVLYCIVFVFFFVFFFFFTKVFSMADVFEIINEKM